jgi:hypothetical protein
MSWTHGETPEAEPKVNSKQKKAFVLMPFKHPFDSYFSEIFRPALESAGYAVERADDLYVSRPIMLDAQESILRADLLLCEMTGRNPNVFYELGLAHAIGKPVILVSRDDDDIPFDLRHLRVLTYEPELPRWDVTLRDKIVHAAQQALAGSSVWPPPLVPIASGIAASPDAGSDQQFPDRPVNLGFEGPSDEHGFPWGWFNSLGYVSNVSADYTVRITDRENPPGGSCLELSKRSATKREFGSVMQRCHTDYLAGKTVRLGAELSTEDVSDWAGIWFRVDGAESPDLFFDNMSRQRLTGTTPWKRFQIDARMPKEAYWMNFGVVLSGSGVVRADNFTLECWGPQGSWMDV